MADRRDKPAVRYAQVLHLWHERTIQGQLAAHVRGACRLGARCQGHRYSLLHLSPCRGEISAGRLGLAVEAVSDRLDPLCHHGSEAVQTAVDGFHTAVAASVEAVADRLDGKAEPPCADLAATLAEVEQTVLVSLAPTAEAASAAHVRGQLALYRALVPQVQHLLAPHSGLVSAVSHAVL